MKVVQKKVVQKNVAQCSVFFFKGGYQVSTPWPNVVIEYIKYSLMWTYINLAVPLSIPPLSIPFPLPSSYPLPLLPSPALLLSRQFQVIQVLLLQLAVLNHSL